MSSSNTQTPTVESNGNIEGTANLEEAHEGVLTDLKDEMETLKVEMEKKTADVNRTADEEIGKVKEESNKKFKDMERQTTAHKAEADELVTKTKIEAQNRINTIIAEFEVKIKKVENDNKRKDECCLSL